MRGISTMLSMLLAVLCFFSLTEASQNFVSVGCFRDSFHGRALPDLIANYRVSLPLFDWSNMTNTINYCAREAQSRGYVYFAVQFWGECWASHNGHVTYDKHGPSTSCRQGLGMGLTNFVYRNTGLENECYAPTILASRDRAMTYENATVDYKCDKQLVEGWYRFQGGAGDGMANTCVAKPKCTTLVQGWLKGALPTPNQGIVPGTVCYQYQGTCCKWSQSIHVRNCGRFYVYKLKPPIYGCPFRYCGNGK